jgi:hypothetical protein
VGFEPSTQGPSDLYATALTTAPNYFNIYIYSQVEHRSFLWPHSNPGGHDFNKLETAPGVEIFQKNLLAQGIRKNLLAQSSNLLTHLF